MSAQSFPLGAGMKLPILLLLCVLVTVGLGKPLLVDSASESVEKNALYKDTEEIMNEWNNEDSYYDYPEEKTKEPVISQLPPELVELIVPETTTTTTTTTTASTTTKQPVYFPNTNIELGPLFEQVGKARRNEIEGPVDLPVPYFVWARDPSGREDKMNYWKKFYNTMYKVD